MGTEYTVLFMHEQSTTWYIHILTCGRVHTCIWICVYILQVLACFVQVIPANSLHSTSSRGKSIAEGIIDLLSDNHWLTGTEVKVQCVRGRLQKTAALCRTPDTVRTPYSHQLAMAAGMVYFGYTQDFLIISDIPCIQFPPDRHGQWGINIW